MLSTESLFVLENRTIGASAKKSCFGGAIEIESVDLLSTPWPSLLLRRIFDLGGKKRTQRGEAPLHAPCGAHHCGAV